MVTAELARPTGGEVARPVGLGRWLTAAERAEHRGHAAARLALGRAQGEDSTSAPLVDTWLAGIEVDNTREAYATDVRLFVEWLRERWQVPDDVPVNLLGVTFDIASAYADAMRSAPGRYGKPLTAKSRARRLSALSALYRHLTRRGKMSGNPVADLERPRYDKDGTTPARALDDLAAMVEAAGDPRDLVVVLLSYVSALRVSEVCNARADDLEYDRGRCVLSVPVKGGKRRREPLDPAICDALDLYLDGRTTGPLVLDALGEPLRRHHVGPILRRLARRAGVKNPHAISPHVMRASAATEWLESGQVIQRVQHKLGHASSTTTEGYHRRSQGLAQDAALSAALVAELPIGAVLDRLRTRAGQPPTEGTAQ